MSAADHQPTLGSLFTGYGGLDHAVLEHYNARLAWWSETEPAATAVTARHHPDVPNLGDITTIDWSHIERPDIICGGFPCQDLSYAGQGATTPHARQRRRTATSHCRLAIVRPGHRRELLDMRDADLYRVVRQTELAARQLGKHGHTVLADLRQWASRGYPATASGAGHEATSGGQPGDPTGQAALRKDRMAAELATLEDALRSLHHAAAVVNSTIVRTLDRAQPKDRKAATTCANPYCEDVSVKAGRCARCYDWLAVSNRTGRTPRERPKQTIDAYNARILKGTDQ